jgi:hypothetical protein
MTAKSSIHIPDKPSDLIPFKVVDVSLTKPIQHTAEMAFDPKAGRARRVILKIVMRPENWTNDRWLLWNWHSVQATELNRLDLSH